jgi:2'-5' RNA ligase
MPEKIYKSSSLFEKNVSKRTRTLVALKISEGLQEEIREVIEKLKTKNYPIFWESPERLALTLVSLGHIALERVVAARRAVRDVSLSSAPFEVKLGSLNYLMHNKDNESILYVEVQDPEKLIRKLYKNLFDNLANEGFYPPLRVIPYIPIGTLKRQKDPNMGRDFLEKLSETPVDFQESLPVNDINIYENIPSGRARIIVGGETKNRHKLLHSFALRG